LTRGGNETGYQRSQIVPVSSTENVSGNVVGNDEQLGCRKDCSDTNGKDGKSGDSRNSVLNSPLKIRGQSNITSRFTIFGTSNTTNNNLLSVRFTIGITDRLRRSLSVLHCDLVVVTIS